MRVVSIDGCSNRCTECTTDNRSITTTDLITDCSTGSTADTTTNCGIKRGAVCEHFKSHES